MNPTNPYNDGNVPKSNDDMGVTLRKMLAELIILVQGDSGGSLYVAFTQAPTSSTPGIAGNYGIFGGQLYMYDGATWYSTILNPIS